jgi:hypothetical protein
LFVGRVLCAQVIRQVNINEPPLFPGFRPGNVARLGPRLQRVRVQAKEFGGLLEVE